jgi:Na+/melibiose symporter-like transporter
MLQLMMFALSLLFYVPVNLIAKKTGKKNLLIVGFAAFLLTFAFTFVLGKVPMDLMLQGYILSFLGAIPLAIFGILPNAMVADIAEADGIVTGNYKAGIFFGARTFMSKMGQSAAGILFPSLLLLGRSVDNDWGIRLTALAAFAFLIVGLLLLLRYNENEINETLAHSKN